MICIQCGELILSYRTIDERYDVFHEQFLLLYLLYRDLPFAIFHFIEFCITLEVTGHFSNGIKKS
jgi:hypothetical protein